MIRNTGYCLLLPPVLKVVAERTAGGTDASLGRTTTAEDSICRPCMTGPSSASISGLHTPALGESGELVVLMVTLLNCNIVVAAEDC